MDSHKSMTEPVQDTNYQVLFLKGDSVKLSNGETL